jgi:PAS domain S-box-containing protein
MDRNPTQMSEFELRKALADEDHFRHADQLNDYLTWRADKDGNIFRLSGRITESHGVTENDVSGTKWIELIHPEDRDATMAAYSHSITTHEPMNYKNRLLHRESGTYRWTKVTAQPRFNKKGEVICWYGVTSDIDDTITMIERQSTLLQELNHRVKNSLATVQSIVLQTFRSLRERDGYNIEAYRTFCDKVMERLLILSSAHDLLTRNSWSGTDLDTLITHTLEAVMAGGRYETNGPAISLCPNASLLLAMVFHELGTNAIKYGAWSNEGGRVIVGWTVVDDYVELVWRERGGPVTVEPDHLGFGTKLITKAGLRELKGETQMKFDPEGLTCYLKIAISEKVSLS